ncbi:MAG: flagellar basal body-associated protein FliL [Methylophilaceae bacterium]
MAQDPVVEEAVAEEAPKKSKKKLIIIIAAVLLLAGIGGGAAWYFMHQKPAHAAGKEKEAKEEVAPTEPVFVKMETFTLNLDPTEGEKFLQTDITLNVASKEEAEILEQHMPQVRNRVLMLLSSKKASEISTMEGKKALSNEIAVQVNQPFVNKGKPQKVTGVFFTSFVIQ